MITGIILRNFKTYKSITFIPISNGDKFCGLIGKNGIGKSSVLEALDFFFNTKDFKVNINSRSANSDECYVIPVFAIEKSLVTDTNIKELAEQLSDSIWQLSHIDINTNTINNNYIEIIRSLSNHIKNFNKNINSDSHYILPLGEAYDRKTSIGVFRDNIFLDKIITPLSDNETTPDKVERVVTRLAPLKDKLKSLFQYVYIPKDIEADKLVQFETLEIQTLLGKKLENIVSDFITKDSIYRISQGLKDFINELSETLPNYKFRATSTNQPNLKSDKIYSLIIQDFFSLRELHKEGGDGKDIPLKELSSGEKQQAILTLIHSVISEYRDGSTKSLIIAVDEPESSLHISACYDQFEKLFHTSKECRQVLFTSHWYGFIPAMHSGSITNIITDSKENNVKHQAYIFNIQKYREEIRHRDAQHNEVHHENLPIDIILKSSNDFVQSILNSVISNSYYNWLICEGSSDKIYLDYYLADEIQTKKLRIIPVCTASEVKNTYNRLSVLFEELRQRFKGQLKGKVFLLMDTDSNPIEFTTHDSLEDNLRCRRIVNDSTTTSLVKINSSPKAPNTDIEDALNGKVFNNTLQWFKEHGRSDLDFVTDDEKEEIASKIAMNLRLSEEQTLDKFFNEDKGNNKVLFAQKYLELAQPENSTPFWIQEIKDYFN